MGFELTTALNLTYGQTSDLSSIEIHPSHDLSVDTVSRTSHGSGEVMEQSLSRV